MAIQDLSKIESQVLQGLCDGKTLSAISEEMEVSIHTVNLILKSAKKTVGAKSIFDAVRIYRLHKSKG